MPSASGRAAVIGAAFAALVTIPGLGLGTLWDNSETAYGEVAREVLLAHDPVVLHLNGAPWFVQPPLYFWIAALCAKLFGVAPFALRLPSALATIAMGAAVGFATARFAGSRAGIYAGVILSTSWMQVALGRLAIMDALLDLCVTATTLWWFRAFEPPRQASELERGKRRRALVFGSLAAGLGLLVKGPVALVVPVLIVGTWALWQRASGVRPQGPRVGAYVLAAAALAITVLPWSFLLAHRAGFKPLAEMVGHYTIGRYVGVIENQSGAWYYYLPVLILGFVPWIAFLPPALASGWRRAAGDDPLARLALVWAFVPIVFFSFARTKLPNYIALEWPALAILTALWFDRVSVGQARRTAIIAVAAMPFTIASVAIALVIFSRNGRFGAELAAVQPDLLILAVTTIVGSLLTLATITARRERWAPYVFALTGASIVLQIVYVIEPRAEAYKPIPPLASVIEAQRRPGDLVVIAGVSGENAVMFYTEPNVRAMQTIGGQFDAASSRTICFAPRLFLLAPVDDLSRIPTVGRRLRVIATAHKVALLLYDGPPCERREAR